MLIATQDAFKTHMTNTTYTVLTKFGAVNPIKDFCASFYLLGYSGLGEQDAVTQVMK